MPELNRIVVINFGMKLEDMSDLADELVALVTSSEVSPELRALAELIHGSVVRAAADRN